MVANSYYGTTSAFRLQKLANRNKNGCKHHEDYYNALKFCETGEFLLKHKSDTCAGCKAIT